MERTVIYDDFSDDFVFPETFDERVCGGRGGKHECPLHQIDEDMTEWCSLTYDNDGDPKEKRKPCPFFGGKSMVKVSEC